ncbi:hypothetical protein BUALT_Bualt19G0067700 [Buddleja alternifolia]|uniref:Uncharacterized protein n=1 Tax=Buddleja alternifolia TaxID=168488 RepID=A0AAV6W9A0_9LAMI|nr:hypothetical protein BUALT_Bualt19G0067700 [Buddleja alternifolia]
MAEGILQFNVASIVEDVLQHHAAGRLSDIDLASRKVHETSVRRYEAAGWLRKMVGVVAGKDLPAEPSEEDFRLGLRSGIILCNVLNKVQPGSVPKVVEAPSDTIIIPDGAALSAYQYFENVRNFLVAIEEMGIPTFEASDLEQGGKASRIVNSVLALKSYNEWKQGGGNGVWKFCGNSKPPSAGKQYFRKNTDLFMNSISRNLSAGEKSLDSLSSDEYSTSDLVQDLNEMGSSHSLHVLVRELLCDKNQEDVPVIVLWLVDLLIVGSIEQIVEHMLSKVMEEFERRLAGQNELIRTTSRDMDVPSFSKPENIESSNIMKDESCSEKGFNYGESKSHSTQHQDLVEHQQRSIQELKNTLHSAKEDVRLLQMKYQEEVNDLSKHVNGLAHAASGYQRVLEENRKLYNQVQDLKGNIRVYCRVRPFLPGQPNALSTVEDLDEKTITLLTPSKYGKGKKSFTFNKVFGPSGTQEEVFADTQPLIRSVLDGYNVCIFAYGQTGSGKTYTMTGPKELTNESLGVNYRALSDLFMISEQRKDTISYDISVQMIEIYNEQVRDLLVTDGLNKKYPFTKFFKVFYVINLMNLGLKNRAVGSTAMNDRSSRSHSCLTVHVQGRDLTSGSILRGCMHLVDLAGSERVDKTDVVGDRLKEAQHINRSLSALGDVIASLAQKQSHVPYRNSKLTQLLQDSLGGQAKTLMFVHISPEPDTLGETLSTLKFAERVSTVELGAARANKDSADVKELKEQIASLKAALARKEVGELGSLQHSESSSPDRQNLMSSGSSPLRSWHSTGYASKVEALSNSSSTSKRHSLDLQDLLMNSGLMEEEKGGWVDKVMMNKENGVSGDNLSEDGRQSPEMFYQKHIPDTSKVYPEQSLKKISARRRHSLDNGLARTQYETVATDDEAATSDSSELDYQLQITIPKSKSMPNGVGSKIRRPSPRPTKTPEMRSQIPQPTRRAANGNYSPMNKNVRQSPNVEGRRKPATGK